MKRRVWIVQFDEGSELQKHNACFSSYEKAKQYFDKICEKYKHDMCFSYEGEMWGYFEYGCELYALYSWSINCYEVDKEIEED